jgi:hypothetical protein
LISTVETDWTIKNKELEKKEDDKNLKKYWRNTIPLNKYSSEINMSITAAAQPILTIVKDEFTKVLTEGTLSPTTKPTDWNVVITKKALLEAMRTPSPPEETRRGLAMLYDTTFLTLEEYCEFTVNRLVLWGNTMEYKLFNTLHVNHRNYTCTIKKLREQATALLEEANRINERDMMIWHEIKNHGRMITRSDLHQQIKKP